MCLTTVKILSLTSSSLHQEVFTIQNILIFCEALPAGGAVRRAVNALSGIKETWPPPVVFVPEPFSVTGLLSDLVVEKQ